MQYRRLGKDGENVSILGYGCMRFPRSNGRLDIPRIENQIRMAVEAGVNYFDTAYIYPGSEAVLGEILEKGKIRQQVKIATKIPPYLVKSRQSMEGILTEQLKRLRTDYIDYYLVHALQDTMGWERVRQMGLMTFLAEKQQEGVIGHLGFSYHGDRHNFKTIIDEYPWDICMVQYNYLDEHSQAGREGILHARSRGVGVAVMEPLRGGSLVGKMPKAIQAIWDGATERRSCAEWALRWLWNQSEVDIVLSGMNQEEHILENIRVAQQATPGMLTADQLALFATMKQAYQKLMVVGCTGCGYCIPCPAGVNIPMSFSCYNDYHLFRKWSAKIQFLLFVGDAIGGKGGLPSRCTQCGKCEIHCPQHLPIREHLAEVQKELEPWWSPAMLGVIRRLLKLKQALSGREQSDR